MRLEAMAVAIPHVEGHPNRVPFEGVLTVVNAASDKAPAGARGHRVMLTREAAEKALPSLLGMAVDYRPGWDGHDARRKIGLLTEADLVGQSAGGARLSLCARFSRGGEDHRGACSGSDGHELRAGRCARGRYAGRGLEADARDIYRRGDPAARESSLPGHQLSHGEARTKPAINAVSVAREL